MDDFWSPYDLLYGQETLGTTYSMLRSFNQLQIVTENDQFEGIMPQKAKKLLKTSKYIKMTYIYYWISY